MKYFRLALYFVVGILLGSIVTFSNAATTIPYKFNGMNVTRDGGVTYLRGTSPSEVVSAGVSVSNHVVSASGASWYAGTGALLQSGGITFNAALPIAASAASVAVTAVRSNPAGLLTSAVASYLLSKGLEYVDGQWAATPSAFPATYKHYWSSNQPSGKNSPAEACLALCGNANNCYPGTYGPSQVPTSGADLWQHCFNRGDSENVRTGWWNPSCPTGYDKVKDGNNYNCVPSPDAPVNPAQESDWDRARSGYWPDPAILDLVKNGVPLPTDKAVFSPTSKDVPLTDPYLSPVDNKRYQDIARVTPQPSSPNTATVEMVKQEVDANGEPVAGSPPSASGDKDPCDLHPERIGCSQWGDPDNSDLPNLDKNVSITPQSGWGPDNGTCPAPLTYTTHAGLVLTMKYDPVCRGATFFRPAILGMAWLSAIFAFFGISRRTET